MNTYVQVEGFSNQWFRLFKKGDTFDNQQRASNVEKMRRKTILESINNDYNNEYANIDFQQRLSYFLDIETGLNKNFLKYEAKVEKFGTLLIREIGSYMLLKGNKITNTIYGNFYPKEKANIVICENDNECEKFWLDYLKNNYPNKSIATLNNFSHRSIEELQENLTGVELITFSTTLGDTTWFENLLKANTKNIPIIGYFHVKEREETAKDLAKKYNQQLTIVKL